jgi:phospholipase C
MTVRLCARLAFAASLAISAPAVAQAQAGVDKLSHILVLYLENRSFDNLFGQFPKANGIANAGPSATQPTGTGRLTSTCRLRDIRSTSMATRLR